MISAFISSIIQDKVAKATDIPMVVISKFLENIHIYYSLNENLENVNFFYSSYILLEKQEIE